MKPDRIEKHNVILSTLFYVFEVVWWPSLSIAEPVLVCFRNPRHMSVQKHLQ